jgi:hypothetical protein
MFWFYLDINQEIINNYWNYTGINYKEYNTKNIELNIFSNDETNDDVSNYIINMLQSNENIKNYFNKINNIEPVSYTLMNPLPIFLFTNSQKQQFKSFLHSRLSNLNLNPFIQTKLEFKGQYRFNVDGFVTSLNYPIFNYNYYFKPGINVYNFGLYPKDIQQSGSLNFKFANNQFLHYELNLLNPVGTIYIITRSYNVLRIADGYACCAW